MILKEPRDLKRCSQRVTFTSSARRAWQCILEHAANLGVERVLLPAYIGETDREGSGVMDPVRHLNSSFEFYRVNECLEPDLGCVENQLQDGRSSLLLLIHYFGFCHVEMQRVKELCRRHSAILVEDCAHVSGLHDQELGAAGDYSFYSIHKCLPTNVGGMLRINNSEAFEAESLLRGDRCPAQVIEQFVRTNLNECSRIRRENYSFLYDQLQSTDGIKLMFQLDESTIPQSFPVRIQDNKREAVYFDLLNQGIPTTALYYRLAKELTEEQFPKSHAVSKSILNLPVHQDTEQADLVHLVDALKHSFEKLAG